MQSREFDRDYADAGEDEALAMVAMLRRIGGTLDTMWRQALMADGGQTAMRLGEASHGVHRALIALSSLSEIHQDPVLSLHETGPAQGRRGLEPHRPDRRRESALSTASPRQ